MGNRDEDTDKGGDDTSDIQDLISDIQHSTEYNENETAGEKRTQTVYEDRELLDTTYTVSKDRVVGRQHQIEDLVQHLKPILNGGPLEDILCYGPAGTGKSLITDIVINEYQDALNEKGRHLAYLTVDCHPIRTNFQAVEALANHAERLPRVKKPVNVSGRSLHQALTNTLSVIDDSYDVCIVVLDNIDRLVDPSAPKASDPEYSDLLYQLSRADEGLGVENLGIIAITDSPGFVREIDERTDSSFSPRDVHFEDYEDANQIKQILEKRTDAFSDDSIQRSAIEFTAAHTIKQGENARKAISLLQAAGDLADEANDSSVTDAHVRQAIDVAVTDGRLSIVQDYNKHQQILLWTAAAVVKYSTRDNDAIPTPVLESIYGFVTDQLGEDKKSAPTISRYLSQFEADQILQRTSGDSDGKSTGVYKQYTLLCDPADLCQELEDTQASLGRVSRYTDTLGRKADELIMNF